MLRTLLRWLGLGAAPAASPVERAPLRRPARPTAPAGAAPAASPRPEAPTPSRPPAPRSPSIPGAPAPADSAGASPHETAVLARLLELRRDPRAAEGDGLALIAALESDLAARRLSIPPLPQAASEALAVCNNPRAESSTLVELLRRDPAIAQSVLRLANSPFYRTAMPCASLEQAVVRVGTGGVRNVLLEVTLGGVLCRPGGPFDALADALWKHSVRTGALARRLSRPFRVKPEEGFAVGLLHDAGKLLVLDAIASQRRRLRRTLDVTPEFVDALLDAVHEPLGATAAAAWNLPWLVSDAIAGHHRREPAPQPRPLEEVVFFADAWDRATERGEAPDAAELVARGKLNVEPAMIAGALAEKPEEASG